MCKVLFTTFFLFMAMGIHGQDIEAELLRDSRATLGEGAFWSAERQLLYWIDIERGRLYTYRPAEDSLSFVDFDKRIGTVVTAPDDGLLLGMDDGIYYYYPGRDSLSRCVCPEGLDQSQRLNDGKCDPGGRFWVGSMASKTHQGQLYRYDIDGQVVMMIDSVRVSNGIVWSADQRTMYYIDTPTRKVMAYDYDIETGDIDSGRCVVLIPDSLGHPDGMTIDERGYLWIGMWGGFSVTCWNPADGSLQACIAVAARNVTSCAFGGPDLDILYITTARIGTSNDLLEQYPHSGGLFWVKLGVKGVPLPGYRLLRTDKE